MMSDDIIIEEVVIGEETMNGGYDKSSESPIESMTSPNKYVQENVIGNGAYGTVYLAQNVSTNQVVAMKRIILPKLGGIPMSTLREITMLKKIDRFNHPNIVKLLDVCHSYKLAPDCTNEIYLIYEHVEQDLATFLNKVPDSGLSERSIKNITHQMLSGISFLHSSGALHRDLKPQNILINNNEVVKLADFGLSKTLNKDSRLTTVVVTLWYRSPEILLNAEYSSPVDVWSVGCIMAEMYKLKPLFMGTSEGDQLDKIFNITGSPDMAEWPSEVLSYNQFAGRQPIPYNMIIPRLSDLANDFLLRMLTFNPAKRITAKEALKHPYLNNSGYVPPVMD